MSAGKGDSPRSCFSREYRDGYDRIFAQRRRGAEKGKAKGEKLKVKDAKPSTHSPRTVPPYPHE